MKACVLHEVGRLTYEDVPEPILRKGEVLLKVKACGICSSDIPRIFATGTYHFPTIPGHEFSGEIVDAADEVNRTLIGKHAVVFPLIPCRKCPSCAIEAYARCENYSYFGSRCDGAFAEYISVPVWNIIVISDEVPFTTAALCEPASVACHCVDAAEIRDGDTVAVIGTGVIGMTAAVWAKIYGAGKVVLIGRNEPKLAFAREIGIKYAINSEQSNFGERFQKIVGSYGADVTLECVGSAKAVASAIKLVRKGGRVVLTGNPEGDIDLSKDIYWKILRGELNVKGTWNSSYSAGKNDWKTTINSLKSGDLNINKLITQTFPLSEYRRALDVIRDPNIFSIKVMLTM